MSPGQRCSYCNEAGHNVRSHLEEYLRLGGSRQNWETARRRSEYGSRPLGIVNRGKQKVRSQKQRRLLHVREIDHTHFVYRDGKVIKKRHIYY